jgi:glycosyltransferase involved in cell wall biosynthesis
MTPILKRRRILYCESSQDGTIGGSHTCLLNLVRGLDKSLYEPIVIFYEDHALIPQFQEVADTIVWREGLHRPVHWGLKKETGSRGKRLAAKVVNGGRFIGTILQYAGFLKERNISLIHLNNSITRHHEWMYAAFLAGVPCVVSERGLPSYTAEDRLVARKLAMIVPMSRWIMNHMVAQGVAPGNIRVVYDGLPRENVHVPRMPEDIRKTYGIMPHQPMIGIVGNIRQWKGQEIVVRALIEVHKAVPDVICFFVGTATVMDQPYYEHLQRLLKDHGIEGQVRFTGYQPDPASFIRAFQVLIHASVSPEPFGMVVLEGMAQRRPVIGSRAGGVIEMIIEGETGFTFPPGDAEVLAKRIVELLRDPDRATKMGEAGYERLQRDFSLERYLESIHGVYEALLKKEAIPHHIGFGYPSEVIAQDEERYESKDRSN